MIFDVLLSRNLCREQLSLCPGVSRFFRGVVFYTLCLHRTRSLVVFSFLVCDFRSLVMWWQRLRAAGGTRLFYSWYHLVFVSFSYLLLGFRQEDIFLFCFQLFLSWSFLPSVVSVLYMLEAATSTSSRLLELTLWGWHCGHIVCHAYMRRSHGWLRFWVVVVMISDWYFSMLSFQHLHDVIYIRLIQTNKPVTRLLRILPL